MADYVMAPVVALDNTMATTGLQVVDTSNIRYGVNQTGFNNRVFACAISGQTNINVYISSPDTNTFGIFWNYYYQISGVQNINGIYIGTGINVASNQSNRVLVPIIPSMSLANAVEYIWNQPSILTKPITYRLTNATTTGPNEAVVGDTVTVPLTFPEGYGVVNPSSDAYVTCNGVLVPSTYSDGQLVFTMPDPS